MKYSARLVKASADDRTNREPEGAEETEEVSNKRKQAIISALQLFKSSAHYTRKEAGVAGSEKKATTCWEVCRHREGGEEGG